MVDDPLGSLVENGGAWMNEYLLVIANCLVALCWVLPTTVVKETGADRLANLGVVFHV